MRTWSAPLGADSRVRIAVSSREDGDLRVSGDARVLDARRRSIIDRPWVWLQQVHGADVMTVGHLASVEQVCGSRADGIVTARTDVAIAAFSADCATVAMWSPEGVIGVVHAGWRGLQAGIVGAAASAMAEHGASTISAYVGPHIGAECYEFGSMDLECMVERFDERVVATTTAGAPSLDVGAALSIDLDRAGIDLVNSSGECTACESERYWSHRARADQQRQALVVWIER